MKRTFAILSLLVLASLACNIGGMVQNTINDQANQLVDSVLGEGSGELVGGLLGGQMNSSTSLWADVPRMDGLEEKSLELPLMMRIAMQAMMGQITSSTGADAEMVTFTTTRPAAEVQAYYSAAMDANVWQIEGDQACYSGSEAGFEGLGALCLFTQDEPSGAQTALAVLVTEDQETALSNVFFIRLLMPQGATPTP